MKSNTNRCIRIEDDKWAMIRQLAAKHGMSAGAVIRSLLSRHLDKDNDPFDPLENNQEIRRFKRTAKDYESEDMR